MDEAKIALMIAELQEIQNNYPKDSSMFRWINNSIFSLDGAKCAIAVSEREKANDV